MNRNNGGKLYIGWGQADITPGEPVFMAGQFHARISEGVMDPVTATALAMESREEGFSDYAVMVSCDLVSIPNGLVNCARDKIRKKVYGLDPERVFLNATHTHAAPECRTAPDELLFLGGNVSALCGLDLPVMDPADYVDFAAERISDAVRQAWEKRSPGGVSFGLGHAVVGRNRRIVYNDGLSRMYGKTDDCNFSHVEGYEDHSLNLLATWNEEKKLTGLVVNVACPAQLSELSYLITADYWHETRQEIRRRFGQDLFILPQCSAAGDQSPHILVDKKAEERMWRLAGYGESQVSGSIVKNALKAGVSRPLAERLSGLAQRRDISVRIADAVGKVLPLAGKEIESEPRFFFLHRKVNLCRNMVSRKDAEEAAKEAEKYHEEYLKMKNELELYPGRKDEYPANDYLRWYGPVTVSYRMYRRNIALRERYEIQKSKPLIPVDIYMVRVGDMIFAANPFECYLDFGMQIKARSKAVQTFLVQLAGTGTYLPTRRSVEGGGYGSVPASNPMGYEAGRQLVEATLEGIDQLWK